RPRILGVGEGHLFHHRKARRLVSGDFAKLGSLFQSFLNGTIKEEFGTAYKELIDSGVSPSVAKKAASRSYKYFDSLGAFD
uniref:hypothetical protein n=1 Tax=Pseudomonas amygdali TaxID=47877 RepID=UPI0018E51B62